MGIPSVTLMGLVAAAAVGAFGHAMWSKAGQETVPSAGPWARATTTTIGALFVAPGEVRGECFIWLTGDGVITVDLRSGVAEEAGPCSPSAVDG